MRPLKTGDEVYYVDEGSPLDLPKVARGVVVDTWQETPTLRWASIGEKKIAERGCFVSSGGVEVELLCVLNRKIRVCEKALEEMKEMLSREHVP